MPRPGSLHLRELRPPLSPDEEPKKTRGKRMRQAADASVLFLPLQSDLQVVPYCAHDEARQIRIHTSSGRLQTTLKIRRILWINTR